MRCPIGFAIVRVPPMRVGRATPDTDAIEAVSSRDPTLTSYRSQRFEMRQDRLTGGPNLAKVTSDE